MLQSDARPEVPTVDAGPEFITLQAGASNDVLQNSVSCNLGSPDFFHADNHYYRTYPLGTLGITADFVVTSVDVGIEEAASASGSQSIQISLHTLDGPMVLENLTLLASESVSIPDQTAAVTTVPISAVAPAGSTLVVEVFTPNGAELENRFFIGSNRESETFPSYLRAPGGNCAIEEPTATNALGVDGLIMSLVLNVSGSHAG